MTDPENSSQKLSNWEAVKGCLPGCALIVSSLIVLGTREIAKNLRHEWNNWKYKKAR